MRPTAAAAGGRSDDPLRAQGNGELNLSLPRFQGQLLGQSAAKSVLLLFSSQFNSYEA